MSKVCVAVLSNAYFTDAEVDDFRRICKQCSFSLSNTISYYEPFLEFYKDKNYTLFNFSDTDFDDVCEMLLLPDGCFLNGKDNPIPFQKRMLHLQKLLAKLLDRAKALDIFIGDSGTKYDEFDNYQICIEEFVETIAVLNSDKAIDVHITIAGDDRTG